VVIILFALGSSVSSLAIWRLWRNERFAHELAEKEHERAERSLKRAREATQATLVELAKHPELKHPKFLPLRKELLDRAKPVFDEFVAQTTDDPADLREQVELCKQMGQLRASIGDYAGANTRYDQALDAARRLTAMMPNDPALERELCDVLTDSAWVRRTSGFMAEGDARVEEAIRRLTARHEAAPTDATTTLALARAELAYRHFRSDQAADPTVEPHVRRALSLVEVVRRAEPTNERAVHLRGRVCRRLAELLCQRGAVAEAVPYFDEAVRIREEQVARAPDDLEQRIDLADTLCQFAGCVPRAAGVRHARRAVQVADEVYQAARTIPAYAVPSVNCHARLGELLGGGDGVRELGIAVERMREAFASAGQPAFYRTPLRDLLNRRADLLASVGRTADAAADRAAAMKLGQ
jgi:tetratricopeptide (TPR) repeat protein